MEVNVADGLHPQCVICGKVGCSYINHMQPGAIIDADKFGVQYDSNVKTTVQSSVDDTHQQVKFSSGAKRSNIAPCYHLIENSFIDRQTNNLEYGWHKHAPDNTGVDPTGDGNWRGAVDRHDVLFLVDTLNHLRKHINRVVEITLAGLRTKEGEDIPDELLNLTEDDIAHASFNLMVISRLWDKWHLDAKFFRSIYQRRLNEWKTKQTSQAQVKYKRKESA